MLFKHTSVRSGDLKFKLGNFFPVSTRLNNCCDKGVDSGNEVDRKGSQCFADKVMYLLMFAIERAIY